MASPTKAELQAEIAELRGVIAALEERVRSIEARPNGQYWIGDPLIQPSGGTVTAVKPGSFVTINGNSNSAAA